MSQKSCSSGSKRRSCWCFTGWHVTKPLSERSQARQEGRRKVGGGREEGEGEEEQEEEEQEEEEEEEERKKKKKKRKKKRKKRKKVDRDGAGDASRSQTVGAVGPINYLCLYHESSGIFEGF